MNKYIKNGTIITTGTPVVDGNTVYYCTSAESYAKLGWEVYTEPTPERTLAVAKAEKIAEIDAFDTSSTVNGFYVNNTIMWLPKADRVGLMNSTTILKEGGETSCSLWYNGTSYTLTCDALISMLSVVEKYALECYNVTAQHKAAVNAMTDIASVDAFNAQAGYPEQLSFTI